MAASEVSLNALVWPFPANWRSPVVSTFSYKTTVFESSSGKEQRRAIRATPRLEIDFLASALDEERMHQLDRFVFENQNTPMVVPDFSRVRPSEVTSGLTILVYGALTWAEAGALVVVKPDDGLPVTRRIAAYEGGVLTLQTAVSFSGAARVYPAIYGRLDTDLGATQVSAAVKELQVGFSGLPGYQIRPYLGQAGVMFDGREVLTLKADWRARSVNFGSQRTDLDYQKGRITTFTPVAFNTRVYRSPFVLFSREELEALVGFYNRRMGQLKEFYAPTWTNDFTVVGSAAGTIRVEDNGATDFSKNVVDRAVMVEYASGQFSYHRITAIAFQGAEQVLSVTPNLSVVSGPIHRVCWMPLCRFASDQMTVTHQTAEVSNAELSIRTLPYTPAST